MKRIVSISPRVKKPLLLIGLLTLWLPVAILLLETAAAARQWYVEKNNLLIAAARAHVPRAESHLDPMPHVECGVQPRWDAFAKSSGLPDWAEPISSLSKEDLEWRREAFLHLDEGSRDLFAMLNNQWVLALDEQRHVKRVYGNWLFREPIMRGLAGPQVDEFLNTLVDVGISESSDPKAYVRASLGTNDEIENDKEVLLLKDNESGLRFAFIPNDYLTLRFKHLPPDTPWDGIAFYRYKKNLRNARSGLGIIFDTNNMGFRDRDVALPKPPGVIRLACIGGSTTEEGPSNDATFPKCVERDLNAALGCGQCVEVFNCGVSGMTTSALVSRLADYLALEPDLIVVHEGVNDIHRDLAEYWRTIDTPRLRAWMSRSRFLRWQCNRALFPDDATMRHDIDALCIANLRAIGFVARGHGIRMAVCGIASPDPERLTSKERDFYDYCARSAGLDPCLDFASYRHILGIYNDAVRAFCEQEGFSYLPLAENFRGGYESFTDLYHMTGAAIERKAEILAACLDEYLRPAIPSRPQPATTAP